MSTDINADFKAYQDRVTSALVNVTRNAAQISSYDLGFHRIQNERVSKSLDNQNIHLLKLTSKLLKAATKETKIKPPVLQDQDDVDHQWRGIVDVVDDLLEKADANLDEFHGVIKRLSPATPSTPELTPAKFLHQPLYRPAVRPQEHFAKRVDNFSKDVWKPLLRAKPHAKIPLDQSIGSGDPSYNHPYAHEIEQYSFPANVRTQKDPVLYTPSAESEPIWVDTIDGVVDMLRELKGAEEIAIDLEHNNNNSYVGMVCLMQISTRNKDWIVDTLTPWREELQILNEVFANPNILKVFHGSTSDMIWLQRDLGLYIVGLFDTYHAAIALNYPQKSLASLLLRFCNFTAQKQYQLADWRMRPLTQELLDYARSDTHYLLFIYDMMRNELVKYSTDGSDMLDYVEEHSKKEALQKYEQPIYDKENGLGPDGWMKQMLTRNMKQLDKQQFAVYRELHEWRDNKARELDEGIHSIMNNVYMWNLAERKPKSYPDIVKNRELGRLPFHVKQNLPQIIEAIQRGDRLGLEGPTVQEVINRNADKLASVRQFKHANPYAKPQEVRQSVAAAMQQCVQNGDVKAATDGATDEVELSAARSARSSLWGRMDLTTMVPTIDPVVAQAALNSIMPVSRYLNNATITNEVVTPLTGHNPNERRKRVADVLEVSTSNVDVEVIEEPEHDVYVPMHSKKRPVDEIEAEDDEVPATDPHNPVLDVPEEDRLPTRRATWLANKNRKTEKKEKAAKAVQTTDFTPFDYTNAPSVLRAKPDSTDDAGAPVTKPLNPFAKALDTSTGARRNRLGKELAGKSHTFKS